MIDAHIALVWLRGIYPWASPRLSSPTGANARDECLNGGARANWPGRTCLAPINPAYFHEWVRHGSSRRNTSGWTPRGRRLALPWARCRISELQSLGGGTKSSASLAGGRFSVDHGQDAEAADPLRCTKRVMCRLPDPQWGTESRAGGSESAGSCRESKRLHRVASLVCLYGLSVRKRCRRRHARSMSWASRRTYALSWQLPSKSNKGANSCSFAQVCMTGNT